MTLSLNMFRDAVAQLRVQFAPATSITNCFSKLGLET